ncbi:LAS seventeen-binding protein 1/2 [Microdochium nivale]|nr:LAS seventeen-binding protein 1/2 [Microdochium nivale]
MPDRQEIIATNKSLRLIKNELETLYEKGVITDVVFDSITQSLPAELSLSGASSTPTPVQSPPANAMASLQLGGHSRSVSASSTPAPLRISAPAPPAYSSNTSGGGGPPQLPSRASGPPVVPPPTKPVVAHARALYKYQAADSRDLSFERDDAIAVHEYMNDDWWMGRNQRTGAEGIFPKTYVQIDHNAAPATTAQGYPNEKAGYYAPQQQSMSAAGGGYPPPPGPGQSSTYNGADQQQPAEPSKLEQGGKKFGKKLGNAAIFGAGATIGSNLVNSIF